jgi:hypothetical protein
MEIIKRDIPHAFLKTLPEGMKFISKGGSDFLVVERLSCQHGHSLITDEVHIHGEASIKLNVKLNNCDGVLFLDSFWGSHTKLYNFIPNNYEKVKIVDIFCPTCGESLIIKELCDQEECNSDRMVQMLLPGTNNRILACARFGCPAHKLEINNVASTVTQQVSDINFFGIGFDDDVFKGV